MSFAIGIDLGTTSTVISIYRPGRPETIMIDGYRTLPSVISLRPDGTVLIGQAAKNCMMVDSDNTVASSKRDMGDLAIRYNLRGKAYTPRNVATEIIRYAVNSVSVSLGAKVSEAVITVPAYFTEDQRKETRLAGEEAGLKVLRILPEPTAAAIAYGMDKGKSQRLLVYDLGGGTFDISILEIQGADFTVRAVGGDSRLGGDDFDRAIMEWMNREIIAQTKRDVLREESTDARRATWVLKEAAEKAKIDLSESSVTRIILPDVCGISLDLELSLQDYNRLIEPMLKKTVEILHNTLRDADLSVDDIDRIILVGGSTKNRAVREIVTQEIKEPYISDNVDEVVSHGAAILAAKLTTDNYLPIEKLQDVTAHSLGIQLLGEKEQLYFQPVIPRQKPYPCRAAFLGATHHPFQEIAGFRIYRGEDTDLSKDVFLGELPLAITKPQSESIPVIAVFELDADGIIHFTGVELPLDGSDEELIHDAIIHDMAVNMDMLDALLSTGRSNMQSVVIKIK